MCNSEMQMPTLHRHGKLCIWRMQLHWLNAGHNWPLSLIDFTMLTSEWLHRALHVCLLSFDVLIALQQQHWVQTNWNKTLRTTRHRTTEACKTNDYVAVINMHRWCKQRFEFAFLPPFGWNRKEFKKREKNNHLCQSNTETKDTIDCGNWMR